MKMWSLLFFVFPVTCMAGHTLLTLTAEPVVSVGTTFKGKRLTLYGFTDAGNLITLSVIGEKRPIHVIKKISKFGIWYPGEAVEIHGLPSYISITTSTNLPKGTQLETVWPNMHDFKTVQPLSNAEKKRLARVLHHLYRTHGLLSFHTLPITKYISFELFTFPINIPATLPAGQYTIRVTAYNPKTQTSTTDIRRIILHPKGLHAVIKKFYATSPFLYALACVLMAILFGLSIPGTTTILQYWHKTRLRKKDAHKKS